MEPFPDQFGLFVPAVRRPIPAGPEDVGSILGAALAATPSCDALADPVMSFTYSELDRAVRGVAALLAGMGLGKGDRVGASLPNGCDIVIAFLAVQKLGAVWVGINTILPDAGKAFILDHSGAKLFLCGSRHAFPIHGTSRPGHAGSSGLKVFTVDAGTDAAHWAEARSGAGAEALVPVEIDPFAPAVIMYTSGTTGSPKGVVHSQHNLLTVCAAISMHGTIRAGGRRGVILPLSIANMMVLGPLLSFWNGQACICGAPGSADAIASWLFSERIQTCVLVPTTVFDLLEADIDLPADLELTAGGAPVSEGLRQRFLARYGYPLTVTYGLTEVPTIAAESRGLPAPAGASGLPLPHLDLACLDESGNPVPPLELGEICIRARQEGAWAHVYTPPLGYWNDPDRTRALLRGGWLHTSDVGSLDADGWLLVADRSSELILRAGSNIYPAEVERVIAEHPFVAACAVVGKEDDRLGKRTVAVVQAASGAAHPDELRKELSDLCASHLPRYKVPDDWLFVSDFPRNAMGKIVRSALASACDFER